MHFFSRNRQGSSKNRSNRGSTLVLIGATILGIVIALLLFALNYTRILGAHEQQRTAIEAAALAAARDFSNIVVEDPNCGFISLSDAAPIRTATTAGDGYYLSIQGINTLLATTRLDMIIADQFNDPVMRQLAARDYQNVIAAKDLLNKALSAAAAGGTASDFNGNVINPVQDAIAAYKANAISMLGPNKCTLIAGSLTLSLGCVTTEPTSTPIPQPGQYAQLAENQQQNGFYLPYANLPYDGEDFVFCATGQDVHLVDSKNVKPTISGLPYQIPSVAICQADETYSYIDSSGQSTKVVHVTASAEPACLLDKVPASGSLQLIFPNGRPFPIGSLQDLLTASFNTAPADYVLKPSQDDAPPAVPAPFEILPGATQHPVFGVTVRVALYDWIRRARTKPNLSSIAAVFPQPFAENVPPNTPHALYFDFAPDGSISTRCASITANMQDVVSQNQYVAATGLAVQQNINTPQQAWWDVIIKDYSFVCGRVNGGKHAGEPFGINGDTIAFSQPGWLYEYITNIEQFSIGPTGGAVRPTYQTPGVAAEILMPLRPNTQPPNP